MGDYDEAEEALLLIQNDKSCADPIYQSWLVRCFIARGKARMAWERYLRMETSEDSFNLLQVRGVCAGCECTSPSLAGADDHHPAGKRIVPCAVHADGVTTGAGLR